MEPDENPADLRTWSAEDLLALELAIFGLSGCEDCEDCT
jgi:hypothetical protein